MIREIATLTIAEGKEADFEAAVAKAAPLFQAAKGCHGMSLDRSVETSSRYFLQIDWATLEDHIVSFRESPAFGAWRSLVSGFFVTPPAVEHSEQRARYF